MSNNNKIILDLCGGTGSWSKPYVKRGYNVQLITLPDNDVRIYTPPNNVYGILCAPPCDNFSPAKHFHGKGKYTYDFTKGLEIVSACMRVVLSCRKTIKFWALENPDGYLKRWLGKPDYQFNPWMFGDNYQKRTNIWGDFNPPTQSVFEKPKGIVKFSMLKSKDIHPEYYGLYNRQVRRAVTPNGFAEAFCEANL